MAIPTWTFWPVGTELIVALTVPVPTWLSPLADVPAMLLIRTTSVTLGAIMTLAVPGTVCASSGADIPTATSDTPVMNKAVRP